MLFLSINDDFIASVKIMFKIAISDHVRLDSNPMTLNSTNGDSLRLSQSIFPFYPDLTLIPEQREHLKKDTANFSRKLITMTLLLTTNILFRCSENLIKKSEVLNDMIELCDKNDILIPAPEFITKQILREDFKNKNIFQLLLDPHL